MAEIIPPNIPQKQCRDCKQLKPATSEFFDKTAFYVSSDGLERQCKVCRSVYRKSKYPHKCCIKCGEMKPASRAGFAPDGQGGREDICKACRLLEKQFRKEMVEAGYKQCNRCNEWKFATTHYFYVYSKSKDSLDGVCIQCKKQTYREAHPAPINNIPDGHKQCTACKEIFLATSQHFWKSREGKYGFQSRCKTCKRKRIALHRNINSQRKRRWYQTNRESVLRRVRANRPRSRELKKARYRANPEKYRDKQRAYDRAHPEQKRLHAQRNYRRHASQFIARARKRAIRKSLVMGSYTTEQIAEQLKRQRYRCYYAACGHKKFEHKNGKYVYHIEHTFPISRVAGTDIPANDISYLVLACPSCNLSKRDKFPWEWPEGGRLL